MDVEEIYNRFKETHKYPKWKRRGEKREKERAKISAGRR